MSRVGMNEKDDFFFTHCTIDMGSCKTISLGGFYLRYYHFRRMIGNCHLPYCRMTRQFGCPMPCRPFCPIPISNANQVFGQPCHHAPPLNKGVRLRRYRTYQRRPRRRKHTMARHRASSHVLRTPSAGTPVARSCRRRKW